MTTATAKKASKPKRQGMGPLPHRGGVAFRVWAPHAECVSVIGSFNDWSSSSHAMSKEQNSYWYCDIPDASVGDPYRYSLRHAGRELTRIDPYARELTDPAGDSVVHNPHFDWTGDSCHTPPLNELVIYQLHVGTFSRNADAPCGTFWNVIDRLDHLQSLGVNTIELLPVTPFAGRNSWGTSPVHLFAVENLYGGPVALKELVKEVHQRGISILLDVVYHHLGPQDVSLWQFDGWTDAQNEGGLYFYDKTRSITPWGPTRPQYGREEVRRYILDNALMWIEEYHFDGLRIDGASYIRSVDPHRDDGRLAAGDELLVSINADLQRIHPGRIRVADDLHDDPWLINDAGEGGAGFSTQWDHEFLQRLREIVFAPRDEERSVESLKHILEKRYGLDAFKRTVFTECLRTMHEGMDRVPTGICPDDPESWWSRKRSTLAAAIALTAPGVPLLFQGQEFLQTGSLQHPHQLDWDRCERFAGIFQLYRDLLHERLNREGHTRGLCGQGIHCFHVDNEQKIMAFRRWDRGGLNDDVLVVVNLCHEPRLYYPIGLPFDGIWQLRLNTDATEYADDFGNIGSGNLKPIEEPYRDQPYRALVSIGPYSLQIYSHEPLNP